MAGDSERHKPHTRGSTGMLATAPWQLQPHTRKVSHKRLKACLPTFQLDRLFHEISLMTLMKLVHVDRLYIHQLVSEWCFCVKHPGGHAVCVK
jgi:hypothetical protein